MREKGFALIIILLATLITIGIVAGLVFYFKSGQLSNKILLENVPVKLKNVQGIKWKLIDLTEDVSFQNVFNGEQVYSGRSFIDMQSNGSYWLLGRGNSAYTLDHFYKYDSKVFTNLSQQFIDMDQIWHIAWNDDYWLLGNSNYVFTKSQLVRYDGETYVDLTEPFRKTPCPSTYEGHITISGIFVSKPVFLIVSHTDLNSCYALYDGTKFQNVSDIFPLQPQNSGFENERVLYNIGDCYKQICYLASGGGSNHIAKYDVKANKVDQIPINDLTNGVTNDAIVSNIKVNSKGEWIFQFASYDIKVKSSKNIIFSYDSSTGSSKVLYQKDGNMLDQELVKLEGWDSLSSKWVILSGKCKGDDKKMCSFSINHLEDGSLLKIPVDLPESPDVPKVGVSSADYLITYKDKLFEVKQE